MKKHILLSLILLIIVPFKTIAQDYLNPNLPRQQRVEDLLSRLTTWEKLGLMMYGSRGVERLGIPEYNWWNEALHGVARAGLATVYPQAIALAATFDPETQLQTFTYISDEARAKYNNAIANNLRGHYQGLSFWTPNINIFRDPRWGRGQETYGEDPYLTSVMGTATVKGLQGNDPNYLKTHSCAKHFAVHSGPEWNRHSFDVVVSSRDLWETYLPAFKALAIDAKVREFMGAYNSYNGDPCCDSDFLMKDILRGRWQYDGLVVSDCWAINDFFVKGAHETHPDRASASVSAVRTGIDIECGDAFNSLVQAVLDDKIEVSEIDVNIRRILNGMFELGFFDPQSMIPWSQLPYSIVDCQKHKDQALKVARESMVLLKNKNKLLPIAPSKVKKIAVIGPNADDKAMLLGNYNGTPSSVVTILDGIKAAYPQAEVIYEQGCDLVEGHTFVDQRIGAKFEEDAYLPSNQRMERRKKYQAEYEELKAIPSENYTPEALAQLASRVKDADVIFFVGGLSPFVEGEEMGVSVDGFRGGDRETIELPEIQTRLLKTLHSTGIPVVFVMCTGSAIGLEQVEPYYDALLCAWYGGQAAGTAVGDILSGKVSPAGKLPITFYKSTAQLPDFQNYDMDGRTYRYMKDSPLYPFGYGLTYSDFKFTKAKLSSSKIAKNQSLILNLCVANKGLVSSDEVIQVYVKRLGDPNAPIKSLKAFQRISLDPGQEQNIALEFGPQAFSYYDNEADDLVVKSGRYEILYGNSSSDKDLKKLSLLIME